MYVTFYLSLITFIVYHNPSANISANSGLIYIENCNKPEKRIDKSMEEKVNLEDAIVMLNP